MEHLKDTHVHSVSATSFPARWCVIINQCEPGETRSCCGQGRDALGILPSMGCGFQPARALHRGWERILGGQPCASPAKVLVVTEKIYDR